MAVLRESDQRVRLHLYSHFLESGGPPTVAQTAAALDLPVGEVEATYRRLAEGRAMVLHPGTLDIWMLNPLSAVPTGFVVEVRGRSYWGNCIWDSLGILAMLDTDGRVVTRCGDCREPLELAVQGGELSRTDWMLHFGVPAAHWWDDIGYT